MEKRLEQRRGDDAEMKTDIKYMREKIDLLMTGIYGNGTKGMKARVAVLETKFWILILLIASLSIWGLKDFIMGCK